MVETSPPAAEARVGLLQTPLNTLRDLNVLVMPLEVAITVRQNPTDTDLLPGQAIWCLTRSEALVLCGGPYKVLCLCVWVTEGFYTNQHIDNK
jgi:hypothetical protein